MSSHRPEHKKTHVLVFPCGSEPASEIHQALRYSIHIELFGASSVDDHGRFRFRNYVGDLPLISESAFDEAFLGVVKRLGINVVFATHDSVAEYLSTRAERMGFFLVNGDPETARMARRKSATYALFRDQTFSPKVYSNLDAVPQWPAVVKPNFGQGGQGVTVVVGPEEASEALRRTAEPLLMEFLPGEEITVDCFTDQRRTLIWVGPRSRERVRAGISMRSRLLEPDPEIEQIAATINRRLPLRGPWFLQLKRDGDGRWKLLEISCRIAGSMVAQRARGINLPLMAVQDYLGLDLAALPEPRVKLVDRRIATRAEFEYVFDTVFVDLNETLIIDGHVTPILAQFLYQCRREGKRIVLLTRQEHNLAEILDSAGISKRLFDEVIHVTDVKPKSDYISGRSILIDNHFPSRLAVSKAWSIPVLGVDMIEFLIR